VQVINLIINSDFNRFNSIHVLRRIHHLEIKSNVIILLKSFRLLLDNTLYLHSFIVKRTVLRALTENWSNVFICNHLSEKIRSLKLYSPRSRSHHFSRNELQQIIRIFGSKCQHLSLSVQSPNNTISLILQNMSQLHSLHVNVNEKPYAPINMIWLEKQQTKYNHSNCFIVNDRDNHYFWLE
jgi:hypothetical protein